MLLMIDNYDSFTYNLVQYLGELGEEVVVRRNDEVTLDEIAAMTPERIVISPGPCTPNEAGISVPLIERFAGEIPLLGVCLGHQSIGQAFGGRIVHARELMHGKTSAITHEGHGVFRELPNPLQATRYHSLVIERDSLPDCLEVTAWTRRRRNHGRATQDAPGRRRAVPSRIDPDRARPRAASQFPGGTQAMTPQEALARVIEHREIFREEMLSLMRQIMTGEVSPTLIAAILVGLRVKKETIGEIAAAAEVMREFATSVPVADEPSLIDTCGTGGDAAHTFNISTAAMFVAAAAGAKIAKHGGRSVSSKSRQRGRAGGARREHQSQAGAGRAQRSHETGIGFMFAPNHHAR